VGVPAVSVDRGPAGVVVLDRSGDATAYDEVVIATHADQALRLLQNPNDDERNLLGAFRYSANTAVLHSDRSLMPRHRATWSSWNYLEEQGCRDCQPPVVTYWMNLLQCLPDAQDFFVTLNPERAPRDVWHKEVCEHPLFDARAIAAQRRLFALQGRHHTWYCGSYFGAGFHEDGLQAGLAVAEAIGGVRRPWTVANESGRICLGQKTSVKDIAA
jgi:predicted NAD/FAD-binding protein